jgi:FKBP-type peptidyl-prolyl cis-trans isomerase
MRISAALLFVLSSFVPLVAGYVVVSPLGAALFLGGQNKGRSSLTTSIRMATTVELEENQGIVKTIFEPGNGMPLRLGDIATVKYSCYLPDDNSDGSTASSAAAPFAQSTKQKMVVGDGSMIDGWEKAIRTMRVGERSIIRINNPDLAYVWHPLFHPTPLLKWICKSWTRPSRRRILILTI